MLNASRIIANAVAFLVFAAVFQQLLASLWSSILTRKAIDDDIGRRYAIRAFAVVGQGKR